MYKCNSCNKTTESFFCPNCGLILKYPQFIENDKIQKHKLQLYVKEFVRKLSKYKIDFSKLSNTEILSRKLLSNFEEHILNLQKMYDNGSMKNREKVFPLIKLLRELADISQTKDCQIAISGIISAGKSTFLSSLLENDVICSCANSETSVLTKIRFSENSNYIKLTYYKTNEWEALWQCVVSANQNSIRNDNEDFLSEFQCYSTEEIKSQSLDKEDDVFYETNTEKFKELVLKYLSNQSPYHFFIKEAEIGLCDFSMPKNVLFIETCGLNDPIPYRKEISNKYLINSDLIMLCIKANGEQLNSYELEEYTNLFSTIKNKEKICIIGTQYDIPNDFSKFWSQITYPAFFKCFSSKPFWDSPNSVENRLHYVSAWYYNILLKALNDDGFLANECNVDYLAEVLCRNLGVSVTYNKGKDAKSLKKCMIEHIEELKSMTNVSNVSNHIVGGAIRGSEKSSLKKFKDLYMNICRMKCATHLTDHPRQASILNNRIIELESKIEKKRKEDKLKKQTINEIIKSL